MKIDKVKPIQGSRILLEQADRLSKRPIITTDTDVLSVEEQARRAALSVLDSENVDPITQHPEIHPGDIADPGPVDQAFSDIEEDLKSLALIHADISEFAKENYNSIATKENNTTGLLKTLRDRLATLRLYTKDISKDRDYISYTFTDGQKLGSVDSENKATYVEEEGVITLPFKKESIVLPEISKIEILDTSNGKAGNNHDRSRQRHAFIDTIIDGSIHTWFEYEKVSDGAPDPLTMTVRLTLKEPTVINHIEVIPALIGAATWPQIKDIQVETSGSLTSIAPDIIDPDWNTPEDLFELSPAISKYAGYGAYTFMPKLATAIQVTIMQSSSYPILEGRKWRNAIALREIAIMQIPFEEEGDFALSPATFDTFIRALGIEQNVKPFSLEDATITYQLSTDGGTTWINVSPLEAKSLIDEEAITFDPPIRSALLKGKIKRNPEAFDRPRQASDSGPEVIEKIIPITTNVTVRHQLDSKPRQFIEAIQIGLGAAGTSAEPLFLGQAKGILGQSQTFYLPFRVESSLDIFLLVDNEKWLPTNDFSNNTGKFFLYDDTTDPPQIIIGDGQEQGQGLSGRLPAPGAQIYLSVTPDITPILSGDSPYKLELSYPSDKIKESTDIYIIGEEVEVEARAAPGADRIEIPEGYGQAILYGLTAPFISLESSERTYLPAFYPEGNRVTFYNGRREFEALNLGNDEYVFSIDPDTGDIYLYPDVDDNGTDLVYRFHARRFNKLPERDWRYSEDENAILISSDAVTPQVEELELEATNSRVRRLVAERFYVENRILKGSVKAIDNSGALAAILETEIDFINGAKEFQDLGLNNLTGFYSIDYDKSRLYLPEEEVFPAGTLQWKTIRLEVHYGIGRPLVRGTEFIQREQYIELTPFFMNQYAEQLNKQPARGRLLVRYDGPPATAVDGKLLEKYYSPVIREINVLGISVNPQLSTLESL